MRRGLLVAVALLALAACGEDPNPGTVHPWDRAPVPAVPDHTHEVTAGGALADGDYWAVLQGASPGVLTFELQQAAFNADGEAVITEEPTRTVEAAAATVVSLTVVGADRFNYAVPVDEVVALVNGGTLSAAAPEAFAFEHYPWLVTTEAGVVTAAHQIWMP